MEYVTAQGERVPAMGLGTWQLSGRKCRQAVEIALDLGYRHLDTAQMYGNEQEIGEALRTSTIDRGELWITTKLGNGNHAAPAVHRSTNESLERLGTEYVDLLLIHWPVEFGRLDETLGAMQELHAEGKVRHLGVSNFTPTQVELALEQAPLLTDQVEYHPFLSQRQLLELCEQRDMILTAYSPLARGRVLDEPVIKEIAEQRRKTPSQVALRWLLDRGPVVVIPKASSREHLEDNVGLFDFELSDEDRAAIDKLGGDDRIIDPPFSAEWER